MTSVWIVHQYLFMKLLKYLFIISYAVLFVYAVFFARRRRHMVQQYLYIYPLRKTVSEFRALHYTNTRDVVNFYSNLAGNFILFIPYTFIVMILFNYKNRWLVLLSVFLLSLSVEIAQYVFRVGVADMDDLILNTAGGCAGILVCIWVQKRWTST